MSDISVIPDNFAVIVAPLHNADYNLAMSKLTEYQAHKFKVTQQNVIILHNWETEKDEMYCVYWLERPMMASVADPPTLPQ